jgi:hypothetical protein
MQLFAGCTNNHIAPHDDQQHKYAKVEYGKYAKDGVFVAKGVYSEYAKDGVYNAKSAYSKNTKQAAFVDKGDNCLSPKRGTTKTLAKGGN